MSTIYNDNHVCPPFSFDYDLIVSCISLVYLAFGINYILFGYRCFKSSMFITGYNFGSAVVYLICLQEYLMPQYGNIAVAVCAGILFGLITTLIQYVGLFITGFHTGMLAAILSLACYDQFVDHRATSYWLFVVAMLSCGILFAVMTLYWKRGMTIIGTSVYGGAMIATSLDYFLERMEMLRWLWDRVRLEPPVAPPCRMTWVALAVWPAAAIVGLTAQCCFTANGIYHEQSIVAQKRQKAVQQSRPLTREERDEMKQRKYRYLYQLRTAHGDVISQSYVQALQKKVQCNNWQCGTGAGGECSTLQSDSTHLTVLNGSDHHHHADSDDDLNQIRVAH